MLFSLIFLEKINNLFVIAMKFGKVDRYIHEILLIKHAKPNQVCYFVCYNHVFVITVIVITEFDCIFFTKSKKFLIKF